MSAALHSGTARPCTDPDCFAPDVTCALGVADYKQCPNWRGADLSPSGREPVDGQAPTERVRQNEAASEAATGDTGPQRPPWSGSAFGTTEAGLVTARGRSRLVTIVGPHNAGKTTMLSAIYLALSRSGIVSLDQFAGSYTLGGWEAVAHGMRWRPGAAPGFPPHTASGAGRAPGLLHLALRRPNHAILDVLLTDAPGEWFTRWAYDRDAPETAPVRWAVHHADAFLFVIDSAALAGSSKGEARGEVRRIAQRLGAECGDRSVATVWTKADVRVADSMRESVEESIARFLPGAARFAVSVQPPESVLTSVDTFLDLLDWAAAANRRIPVTLPSAAPPTAGSDPFFVFKGERQLGASEAAR